MPDSRVCTHGNGWINKQRRSGKGETVEGAPGRFGERVVSRDSRGVQGNKGRSSSDKAVEVIIRRDGEKKRDVGGQQEAESR